MSVASRCVVYVGGRNSLALQRRLVVAALGCGNGEGHRDRYLFVGLWRMRRYCGLFGDCKRLSVLGLSKGRLSTVLGCRVPVHVEVDNALSWKYSIKRRTREES
jgi:hypothetical protein